MLIFRKQLFFNRACQVRRDRDFEFPTARIGGAGEGVDYRLWVAMARLAIVVKDVDQGLVDFLGKRNGRDIYLCWQYGEDDIDYWHDLNTGFAGRHPIDRQVQ